MKDFLDILMIISSIGVLNSVFFIIVLLHDTKGNKILNRLLALLILAYTFRIGKSVIFYFTDDLDDIVINIGFSAFLTIGPSLLMYFKAVSKKSTRIRKIQYLHFIPAALVFLLSWYIPYSPSVNYWKLGYSLILMQIFIYLLLSFKVFLEYKEKIIENSGDSRLLDWLRILLIAASIVWFAYFMHFNLKIGLYINGAIAYSLIIYIVLYKWNDINRRGKHLHSMEFIFASDLSMKEDILSKLENLMKKIKIYRNPELNIKCVANQLGIQPYLLSRLINTSFHTNFNDYINTFRIEEAKEILNSGNDTIKIACIAYDIGFNSISSFNMAFKKKENITPSQYRSYLLEKELK